MGSLCPSVIALFLTSSSLLQIFATNVLSVPVSTSSLLLPVQPIPRLLLSQPTPPVLVLPPFSLDLLVSWVLFSLAYFNRLLWRFIFDTYSSTAFLWSVFLTTASTSGSYFFPDPSHTAGMSWATPRYFVFSTTTVTILRCPTPRLAQPRHHRFYRRESPLTPALRYLEPWGPHRNSRRPTATGLLKHQPEPPAAPAVIGLSAH